MIIFTFQVVIALPFLLGDSTISDYIRRSKLTGQGRNGIAFAGPEWDYLASMKDLSILWKFISNECYYDRDCLARNCTVAMLGLNVYHFFIRKWAFKKCWNNFIGFVLCKKKDFVGFKNEDEKKHVIEILLIGFFIGINLMPGAHSQFQIWYMYFMPLLIYMTGIPKILTFWIFAHYWPLNHHHSIIRINVENQQKVMLSVLFWLLTVGPI